MKSPMAIAEAVSELETAIGPILKMLDGGKSSDTSEPTYKQLDVVLADELLSHNMRLEQIRENIIRLIERVSL